MDDLIRPPKLRVLVLDRVEAVRAARDNPLHPVLVQRRHVRPNHRLCEVLVADATRRVPRALFLGSQDGESNAGLPPDAGEGLRALPVQISGAADALAPTDHLARV